MADQTSQPEIVNKKMHSSGGSSSPLKHPLTQKKPEPAPQERVRAGDIIRFVETNLDGTKKVGSAIRGIKGVSFMFAHAVAKASGFSSRPLNSLSESDLNALEDVILHPTAHGLPVWLINRRSDPFTAAVSHLSASALDFTTRADINEMKRIKSYKGVRHSAGQPVRGQRTRNTSRTGTTVGVLRDKKKKEALAAAAQAKGADKKK